VKNWMINAATILFDDTKNDLRALPKTVRLQLLTVLSFVWSTAFTLYIWGQLYASIWTGLVIGHIVIIMAMYYTFKQFHNIKNNKYNFGSYHSYGRARDYVFYRDKHGNPYKVKLDPRDPGGEHE
jgi:4-hydroxybenzoate polyprenyltransferase